jgi:phytoene dehydrogenase-like protein
MGHNYRGSAAVDSEFVFRVMPSYVTFLEVIDLFRTLDLHRSEDENRHHR